MLNTDQQQICTKFGASFSPPLANSKLGVSLNVKTSLIPVNGLRHPPALQTNGWYIWAGEEFPIAEDAFKPLHYQHIGQWNVLVIKYLALPPGWRFLTNGSYEDVWFDNTLLSAQFS